MSRKIRTMAACLGVLFLLGCLIAGNSHGAPFSVESGFEDHPVTYVSWYGAMALAEHYGWRLPTADEWETVANFTDGRRYATGHSLTVADPFDVDGRLVTVGGRVGARSAAILTSTDGINWSLQGSPSRHLLNAVLHTTGAYVAVGRWGTIVRSDDGVDWTPVNSAIGAHLHTLAYGNGRFVAGGERGTILNSADGIRWTRQNSGTRNTLYGLTRNNERFVAVGARGVVLTSPDGENWTRRSSGTGALLNDIAFTHGEAEGLFVAVGQWGTVLISSDGIVWETVESGVSHHLNSVSYSAGRFVAVGDSGTIITAERRSPGSWEAVDPGTTVDIDDVVDAGGGGFVAVGAHGIVLTSPDGQVWTQRESGVLTFLKSTAFSGH